MGCSQSYPGLTEDVLEDYQSLTYLNKGEILYLMKKFYSINPEKVEADYNCRFHKYEIINKFDVLKNNPFQDRIFRVFSSKKDDCFSFEDLLDLYSVMSSECPVQVKATWAFRIYDLNEDNLITSSDICGAIDRLTQDPSHPEARIDTFSKHKIAKKLLEELQLLNNGGIGVSEFTIMISRIPDFESGFYFRI